MSNHYVDTLRKARKTHRCWLCYREIRRPEMYRHSVALLDGTAWTNKTCLHCDALVSVRYRQAGLSDEYDETLLTDWEPQTVAEARLRAQYRRRWRRFDGSLYPLPQVRWYEDRHGFRYPVGLSAS